MKTQTEEPVNEELKDDDYVSDDIPSEECEFENHCEQSSPITNYNRNCALPSILTKYDFTKEELKSSKTFFGNKDFETPRRTTYLSINKTPSSTFVSVSRQSSPQKLS